MNSINNIPPTYKPVIESDWHLLYRPEKTGNYINDHTILKGYDNKWHLIGITNHQNEPNSDYERYFSYGSGNKLSLDKPFDEIKNVCNLGVRAWAPCVIKHRHKYYMYYGPSPTRFAVSPDLGHWMENKIEMIGVPIDSCHRDHMVFKLNENTWIMYVSGIDMNNLAVISVLVSNDLIHWRFVQYALRTSVDSPYKCTWGQLESPYLIYYKGWYYLSVTYTNSAVENYHNTLIFRSLNPYDFGVYSGKNEVVVQKLFAHAPEYIYDEDSDNWYITTCGWRGKNIPHEGGVSIAKLKWLQDAQKVPL